ncbi:MAG: laccase domain-containing protein, partial [Stellaceae bacterium]
RQARIRAGIGPAIAQTSYQVGAEFPAPFLADDPGQARFFRAEPEGDHFRFDLPGYVAARLDPLGLGAIDAVRGDTAAEPERFFSYRRNRRAGTHDYGRLISAIALL